MNAPTFRQGAQEAERGETLNRAEARVLFNPSPEVDSLAERLAELRRYGVPRHTIEALLRDVHRVIALNGRELDTHTTVRDLFEDCARVAHGAQVNRRHGSDVLTVKELARALRAPLGVIRDVERGKPVDAVAYQQACSCVTRIIDTHPRSVLLTASLRNEIGPGKYDLLRRQVQERVR